MIVELLRAEGALAEFLIFGILETIDLKKMLWRDCPYAKLNS